MIYLLCVVPLLITLVIKFLKPHEITKQEFIATVSLCSLVGILVYFLCLYISLTDTKYLNGSVLDKSRRNYTYVVTYPCNCRTVGKVTSCSVCTQTHYAVEWSIKTEYGPITLDTADGLTPLTWARPNPPIYTNCSIGDPATVDKTYNNYFQHSSNSLFSYSEAFSGLSIKYPNIFNKYQYNRVVVTSEIRNQVDTLPINSQLNKDLIRWGVQTGINPVLIISSNNIPKSAIEKSVNINDVILIIKLNQQTESIDTVDTVLYANGSGNETFKANLDTALLQVKGLTLDNAKLPEVLQSVYPLFKAQDPEKWDYLWTDMELPTWVIVLLIIISAVGSLILGFIFANNNETED